MQRARVLGQAISTVKHPTMEGHRLLVAQPLDTRGKADGDPFLVVDALGASAGHVALVSSDGKFAQETLGKTTPVRFTVIGLED